MTAARTSSAATSCSTRATRATGSTSSARARSSSAARSTDGRENLLAILGPGEMFGELSLFDPGPRTMTATAVAETQLLGLGHDDLQRPGSTGRPDVAKVLLAALAQRLRRTNETPGRPRLHRRTRPRRQGAARPVGPLRPPRRGGHPRRARPHPGGAGPAGRRLPRDGQQGARRLREPRLAARSRPAPCCCSTSSGSSAAPADPPPRAVHGSGVRAQVVQLGASTLSRPPATPRAARRRRPARPRRRRVAAPSAERLPHLLEPLGAVRRGRTRPSPARPAGRAVPGRIVVTVTVAGQVREPLQRGEVCRQLTVGVRDHRRAAAEDRVAGEQRVVGGQRRRRASRGCARGSRRRAARARRPSPGHRRRGRRGRGRAARTGAPVSSANRLGALGVVGVAVGEDRAGHARPAGGHGVDAPRAGGSSSSGPGVDDDAPRRARARAAPTCWCRRGSSGPGWGQHAERALGDLPASHCRAADGAGRSAGLSPRVRCTCRTELLC